MGLRPLASCTVLSRATITKSFAFFPPAFFAASKNLTCPRCSRSNTPEANTIFVLFGLPATRISLPPAVLMCPIDPRSMPRKLSLSQAFPELYNTLHLLGSREHTRAHRRSFRHLRLLDR